MAWRTIDGATVDPLGTFNELQTLVRGVLAPAYLLDFLRYFVLFEEDGTRAVGWSRRSPATTSSMRCVQPSRRWWPHPGPMGRRACAARVWRGVAHPGQRQEHHHDLLDGQPDHRGDHRPQ